MYVTSKPQQWLADIAVREAGVFESTLEMALANNIGITDVLTPGARLIAPALVDKRVNNYYKMDNIYPATATTLEEKQQGGGINYMAVEINFIVS